MLGNKHLRIAILALLVIVVVAGSVLVWPNYRDAAAMSRQVAEMLRKGDSYDAQIEEIDRLTAELAQVNRRVDTELKFIPGSPDIAGLIRVLSLPADGETIRDQTFTAGQAQPAVPDSEGTTLAMPLTVDMVARFDSAFALLRAAESMQRLLRITSVNAVCERQGDDDQPFVRISVGLEAIYEPPVVKEDR